MTSLVDVPAAPEGAGDRPPRRRWPAVAVLLLVLALVAAWAVHRLTAPGFPASDSRACAGSTQPLETKARDVSLVLPHHARHLAYRTADQAPYLLASFSLDRADLQQWLAANRLPKPQVVVPEPSFGAPCGSFDLEDGLADPVFAQTTLPGGTFLLVAVAMNGVAADRSTPVVHVMVSPTMPA